MSTDPILRGGGWKTRDLDDHYRGGHVALNTRGFAIQRSRRSEGRNRFGLRLVLTEDAR